MSIKRWAVIVSLTGASLWGQSHPAAASPTPSSFTHRGPHARDSHVAAYDAVTDQVLIYGGQHTAITPNEDNVWYAIGASNTSTLQWKKASPTGTHPPARFGHSGAYAAASGIWVIFGGDTGMAATPVCQNDLWLLNHANSFGKNAAWAQLPAVGVPPIPRAFHASGYDPASDTMIIFGGTDCLGGYLNDVWLLNQASGVGGAPIWTQLTVSGSGPSQRESASGVYDPVSNSFIIYGGDNGTSVFGDVWVLTQANGKGGASSWVQLSPTGSAPAPRTGQATAYDSANNILLMYGGSLDLTGKTLVSDYWILSGANGSEGESEWAQIPLGSAALQRAYLTATYNPAKNLLFLFGGKTPVPLLPTDDHVSVVSSANGITLPKSGKSLRP